MSKIGKHFNMNGFIMDDFLDYVHELYSEQQFYESTHKSTKKKKKETKKKGVRWTR